MITMNSKSLRLAVLPDGRCFPQAFVSGLGHLFSDSSTMGSDFKSENESSYITFANQKVPAGLPLSIPLGTIVLLAHPSHSLPSPCARNPDLGSRPVSRLYPGPGCLAVAGLDPLPIPFLPLPSRPFLGTLALVALWLTGLDPHRIPFLSLIRGTLALGVGP